MRYFVGIYFIIPLWTRNIPWYIFPYTTCSTHVHAASGTKFWCGWCGTAPLAGLSHQIAPFTKNRTTNKNSHHTTPLLQNRFKPHRHNKSWSHLLPLDPTLFLPLHVKSRDSALVSGDVQQSSCCSCHVTDHEIKLIACYNLTYSIPFYPCIKTN